MEQQEHKISLNIVKNKRVARIIARSASRLNRRGFKAVMTPEGWIVGEKHKIKRIDIR